VEVAPSILSADFARLGAQVEEVMSAGARVIHVDVMDGHFVPPITMGPLVVEALSDYDAFLDVHLMIERPERQIEAFARAGADQMTVHQEATPNLHYAVKAIREAGCKAGVAINPGTPAGAVAAIDCDLLLVMTVDPGWGGQRFIEETLPKIEQLRGAGVPIEVDGGIDATTAPRCAQAGASWFVAGSSIFGDPDPGTAYRRIADALEGT